VNDFILPRIVAWPANPCGDDVIPGAWSATGQFSRFNRREPNPGQMKTPAWFHPNSDAPLSLSPSECPPLSPGKVAIDLIFDFSAFTRQEVTSNFRENHLGQTKLAMVANGGTGVAFKVHRSRGCLTYGKLSHYPNPEVIPSNVT
jgi:hypothetical protein